MKSIYSSLVPENTEISQYDLRYDDSDKHVLAVLGL